MKTKATPKKGKAIIWLVLVGIALVVLLYGYREMKKRRELAKATAGSGSFSGSGSSSNSSGGTSGIGGMAGGSLGGSPRPNPAFPLKMGSKGPEVKQLQQFLLSRGFNSVGSADGSWGPKTDAAMKAASDAINKTFGRNVEGIYPALSESRYKWMQTNLR